MINQEDLNNYIGNCNDSLLNKIGEQFGLNNDDINKINHSKKSILISLYQAKSKK